MCQRNIHGYMIHGYPYPRQAWVLRLHVVRPSVCPSVCQSVRLLGVLRYASL